MAGALLSVVAVAGARPSIAQTAPSADSPQTRPGSWDGSGAALGARLYFNTDPRLLPVDDMLTIHAPDVQTDWDSTGDANARASSVFPGQTVVGLPDLLASFGVAGIDQILPPYPLTAFASPTSPDATTDDGSSRAQVDPDGDFIEAKGSLSVGGLTDALSPFISVGPGSATSHQSFVEGALTSRASASMGDISVLGGLVRVGAIEVTASAAAAEQGTPTTETSVSVGNISILGVPVGVSAEGIEVAGMVIPPGGLPDDFNPPGIAGRINDVVSAFGLRIQLLDGVESVDGQTAQATANGMLIEANVPLDGPRLPTIPLDQLPINPNDLLTGLPLPVPDLDPNVVYRNYLVSVVIGEARAAATAGSGLGTLSTTSLSESAPEPAPTTTAGGVSSGGLGSSGSTGGTSATSSPAAPSGGVDVETASPVSSSDSSSLVLLADSLGFVFAGLAAIAVLGLIGARASTAPFRMPGQIRSSGPTER